MPKSIPSIFLRLPLLILSLFLSISVLAQDDNQDSISKGKSNKETKNAIDNNYIIDYSDQLTLKILGAKKSNSITHNDNFTKSSIEYKPNENFNFGLGVAYKWLSMDLTFGTPLSRDDNAVFGSTKKIDLQFNIYTRRFLVDINLQSYKGYYGSNPADYDTSFDKNNPIYPIRSDLSTVNIGVSTLYVFNHERFSYRSAFVFNERQVKSAGSFLAGAFTNIYEMNADSVLIPHQVRSDFNPDADFRATTYLIIGAIGGYGHTFVIAKRIYFSMTLVLGFGPELKSQSALPNREAKSETRLGSRITGRVALGYNSERFFTGISIVGVGSGGRNDREAHLERGLNNFKIFVGTRLVPPKFLTKK